MLWMTIVEWLARLVLILLIGLSFWSMTIIIDRRRFFKNFKLNPDDVQKEISRFKHTEQIEKAFDAYTAQRKKEMEKGLAVLGTLGSTSPFIGLLGTILGIIVSFGELSQGGGSTNQVMFSLAEALILTAVGLVVAIPAVVAFNYFSRSIRNILVDAAAIKDLFIAHKER
jgi:biopolymer transport protein ExbB/TolQ